MNKTTFVVLIVYACNTELKIRNIDRLKRKCAESKALFYSGKDSRETFFKKVSLEPFKNFYDTDI